MITAPSLCLLQVAALSVTTALAQSPERVSLQGTWNVHIEHSSGRVVDEQWIVEQTEARVKGRVETARGTFPLEGTVDDQTIVVKVTVSADRFNIFRGTVDADSIKGTIEQKGDDGTFSATRKPVSRRGSASLPGAPVSPQARHANLGTSE